MMISKTKIIEALVDRGEHLRAGWVDRELPESVDTNQHGGLLALLHLDPARLDSGPPS